MIPYTLYIIVCAVNGKLYAGITSRELAIRWNEHLKAAKGQQPASIVHLAMRKYGVDNFSIEAMYTYPTEEEAKYAEESVIAALNLTRLGYNASPGGDISPTLGVGHTDATKAKLSAAAKKQHASPEARAALSERAKAQMAVPENKERIAAKLRGRKRPDISERMKGRKLSPEHASLVRTMNVGRKRSPDTLARMSGAQYDRWYKHRIEEAQFPTKITPLNERIFHDIYPSMGTM